MESFQSYDHAIIIGAYHRPPLLHMAKGFIWIEETKECITEFSIGYMINPILYINRAFREQVHKCMNNTFVHLFYECSINI